MDFILRSGQTWTLSPDVLCDYQETFRRLAVVGELRKAQRWLVDNPGRRKTARGMPRFLNGWLARVVVYNDGPNGPHMVPWDCPHDPKCLQRWHCAKRDEFDRVKAQVVAEREAR